MPTAQQNGQDTSGKAARTLSSCETKLPDRNLGFRGPVAKAQQSCHLKFSTASLVTPSQHLHKLSAAGNCSVSFFASSSASCETWGRSPASALRLYASLGLQRRSSSQPSRRPSPGCTRCPLSRFLSSARPGPATQGNLDELAISKVRPLGLQELHLHRVLSEAETLPSDASGPKEAPGLGASPLTRTLYCRSSWYMDSTCKWTEPLLWGVVGDVRRELRDASCQGESRMDSGYAGSRNARATATRLESTRSTYSPMLHADFGGQA